MSDGKWYVTARYQYNDELIARGIYEDLNKCVGGSACIGVTLSNAPEPECTTPADTPPHVYKRTVTARAIKWTGDNIAEVAEFLVHCPVDMLMRVDAVGALHVCTESRSMPVCRIGCGEWLVFEGIKPAAFEDAEFQKVYQR